MRLIDGEALYERLVELENLARDRVIDTPNSFPDGSLNPAAVRYMAQLSERIQLKEMVFDAPTIKPEPHWIPCSERLPEMHTDVLTCDTYGGMWIFSLIFTGRNNEACWEDDYGYLHNFDEQIAWMPLPSPYQSESEE